MGKYTSWITLFAIGGTLAAVAAVAITEAFVPATLLVLTAGEWELVAAVLYILAILLYLGEGHRMGSRGVSFPLFATVRAHHQASPGLSRARQADIEHDAAFVQTLEVAEA